MVDGGTVRRVHNLVYDLDLVGVFNDCEGLDEDGDGVVDEVWVAGSAPTAEQDTDGDGFVECAPDSGISWLNPDTDPNPYFSEGAYSLSDPYHVAYADETGTCFCLDVADAAGNDFTCGVTCVDASGTTCTPIGACEAVGGYSDCVDTASGNGALIHADADEVCDGQHNDCRDLSWDEGDPDTWPDRDEVDSSGTYINVPESERDDDGDGRVACQDFSSSLWLGYGSASVVDGEDCDDDQSDVYAHAADLCDGQVNDCDSPELATYNGAVGVGCFCTGAAGSVCVDASGAACVASSYDDIVALAEAEEIGGTDYGYVEVSHYCESSVCELDPDGDGYVDCAEPDGSRATSLSAADAAADCVEIEPFTFASHPVLSALDVDGDGEIDVSYSEYDVDGDGYVDCDGLGYSGGGWGDGPEPSVGWDCKEGDGSVYPEAEEVCDGQYNDCNDYSSVGAPADEEDLDGDGYVACDYEGEDWQGSAEPEVGWDCRPEDANSYPGAPEQCNGVFDDCAAADYSESGAPSAESDDDGDGYVECYDGTSAWYGTPVPALGVDCDDTDPYVFTGAEEHCDGQYNDCASAGFDRFGIPDDEADLDGDGFVSCVPTASSVPWSDLSLDPNPVSLELIAYLDESGTCLCDAVTEVGACSGACATWAGVPCEPADEDGDLMATCALYSGFGDCDDGEFEDHPGAEELCDARDNDCDGDADEELPDADSDGECDELDTEECDGQDNTGDGVVDEGCDTGDPSPDTGEPGGREDTGKDGDGAGCRGTGATWGLLLAPLLWVRRRRGAVGEG